MDVQARNCAAVCLLNVVVCISEVKKPEGTGARRWCRERNTTDARKTEPLQTTKYCIFGNISLLLYALQRWRNLRELSHLVPHKHDHLFETMSNDETK